MSIRVKAIRKRWSGHGEGGVTAHVVYDKQVGDTYNASQKEHDEAMQLADDINDALREAGL